MSQVIILGAGLAGLTAAALLARDGHEVTVLEKDPAAIPDEAADAVAMNRPGVHQFRHIHLNLARWLQDAQAELPGLGDQLLAAGGLHLNLLNANPALSASEYTAQDSIFETVTARRPVMEAVLAQFAQDTPGVRIMRGERVTGLLREPASAQVTGVRTDSGDWTADLVVDATGRRSAISTWLTDANLPAPAETVATASSVYYSRHFRSPDGSMPEFRAGTLQLYNGLSVITLPADSGSWSVALVAREDDRELRTLRDPSIWTQALAQYPAAAHWLNGEPLTEEIQMIAALHDRSRTLLRDDLATVGGLVLLGDSWACSDPSLGRGSSITFRHAMILRDTLRSYDSDLPATDFVYSFETDSRQVLGPILQRSWSFIRNRLAEMDGDISGEPAELGQGWRQTQASRSAELNDPQLARGFAGVAYLLQSSEDAFGDRLGMLAERISDRLAGDFDPYPLPGPDRQELLDILRH